ncbi:Mss4-like protein, partial [Trichophaea hybrida]
SPLTGGCLCGSIRYTIDFPPSSSYPPLYSTCHCIQCRKTIGTLTLHLLTVSPSQITWSPTNETETFKEFRSSPECLRGFCSTCGTSVTWRDVRKKGEIDVFLGTIDDGAEEGIGGPREQVFCREAVRGLSEPVEGVTGGWGGRGGRGGLDGGRGEKRIERGVLEVRAEDGRIKLLASTTMVALNGHRESRR